MSRMQKDLKTKTILDQNSRKVRKVQQSINGTTVSKKKSNPKIIGKKTDLKTFNKKSDHEINRLPSENLADINENIDSNTATVQNPPSPRNPTETTTVQNDRKETLENKSTKPTFYFPDEPQPLEFDPLFDVNIDYSVADQMPIKSAQNLPYKMSYYDYHLANVLHTKVLAHSSGFPANSLAIWYENTFQKALPTNWLELIKISGKFEIENIADNNFIHALKTKIGEEDFLSEVYKLSEGIYNEI